MQPVPFTLVLGGAASGKSAHAEGLVRAMGARPVYIATAEAHDAEMAARIAAHRAARDGQGWRTVEAPRHPEAALAALGSGEAALLDCVTLWLTNTMLAGADWAAACDRLLGALAACPAPVVAVSNDVSGGIVPENALARAFRDAQGRVNQRLADAADRVVLVTAGLPLVLKDAPA